MSELEYFALTACYPEECAHAASMYDRAIMTSGYTQEDQEWYYKVWLIEMNATDIQWAVFNAMRRKLANV